ncbi:MAG TPA: FAD binding domain-containing protein [Streptosporangiaceae bacterium]
MDLPGITEVADARSAAWRAGDAWLAGGTWLFSEPQPGLTRLLDLQAFGWPSLQASAAGLEIAATCTLAELAGLAQGEPDDSPGSPWRARPLFGQCCHALLGSFKVWNAATVGGNLCLALPAGPMISLTAALDGVCTIWGPDRAPRRVPVTDFVTGAGRCALAPGELLRSVSLPARALASVTAFRQLSLSDLGRSAAVVIGRRPAPYVWPPDALSSGVRRPDPGTAADGVVITLTAATTRPVQLRFAAVPAPGELRAAIDAARPPWHDDVYGAPAWRAAVSRDLALEVLDELAAA